MRHNYGQVFVLMGGWSNERDVSLVSGQCVFNSLEFSGINVVKLDLKKFDQVCRYLKKFKPDVIVNCAAMVGGVHSNNTKPNRALCFFLIT